MPKWTDKPWERQKGESEKAFEAFVTYRDMGEKRTLTAVAEKLQKSGTLIRRWKSAWDWAERVRAYDNELEKEAHTKAVKDRKAMVDRHIGIAMQLQKKALEALGHLSAEEMSAKDIKECDVCSRRTLDEQQGRGAAVGSRLLGGRPLHIRPGSKDRYVAETEVGKRQPVL